MLLEDKIRVKRKRKHWTGAKVAAAVLVTAIMVVALQPELRAYAANALKSFAILVGTRKLELEEMVPIEIDINRFAEQPGVKMYKTDTPKREGYYVTCANSSIFKDYTGIELNDNDEISLNNICIDISVYHKNAHLVMKVTSKSDGTTVGMNG